MQPPRSPLEVVVDDAVGRDAVIDVFEHDQYGVLIRLGAGNPISESEDAISDALVFEEIEFLDVLVFECSYTAAELAELLDYLDSEEWRDPDGGTPKARADLSRDVTGGLISNCAVVFPVDCATPSEIDRIVEHATSLNVTNIDMWTGGRGDLLNPPDGAVLELGRPSSNCPDN